MPQPSRQSWLVIGIVLGLMAAGGYLLSALLSFSPKTPTVNDAHVGESLGTLPPLSDSVTPTSAVAEYTTDASQTGSSAVESAIQSDEIPNLQLAGVFLHPDPTQSTAVILNGSQSHAYHLQEVVYQGWALTRVDADSIELRKGAHTIHLPLRTYGATNSTAAAMTPEMATITSVSRSGSSGYQPQSDSEIRQELASKLKVLRQAKLEKSPRG